MTPSDLPAGRSTDGEPAPPPRRAVLDDLTAVRGELVYDPTIPRHYLEEAGDAEPTDDTVRADTLAVPRTSEVSHEEPLSLDRTESRHQHDLTWFAPDQEDVVLPGPREKTQAERHPDQPGKKRRTKGRDTTDQRKKKRSSGTWLREIAVVVVAALVVTSLVRMFVFQPFAVPSQSMENTLEISDKIVVSKAAGFTRGDVVVFRDDLGWLPSERTRPGGLRGFAEKVGLLPDSTEQHLVKRVVGMPGDIVACCDNKGRVTVNGGSLDETSYLYPPEPTQPQRAARVPFRVTVPEGKIFVLGDNRYDSADSRCHLDPDADTAFIDEEAVLGPVNLIVSPVSRWRYLRPPEVYATVPDPPAPPPPAPRVETEGGC